MLQKYNLLSKKAISILYSEPLTCYKKTKYREWRVINGSFGSCGPQQPCLCGVLLRSLLPPVPGCKVYKPTEKGPGSFLTLNWMLRMPCCLSHQPITLSLPPTVVCKNLQPPSSPTLRLIPNPFCPAFPACLPDHLHGIFTSWRLFLLSSSSVFPRLPLANPPFLAASVFSRYRFLAVCCEPQALTSSCKLSSSRKH